MWRATKTWKARSDPDLTAKMRRILDLCDHPPVDGWVLCVDEFGRWTCNPAPVASTIWVVTEAVRRTNLHHSRPDLVR
ncbi:hypothetical protein GCM10029963_77340 [Micromonospora andamanensis]|uniref:Transposase n=1 Tax=Micromonospora andamanensis TaxID=1287068 RepID=A0ABQ4I2F3_9ACTN|nr:hypothetical protein Van01_52640 [Micromonospora andamanensis]GIJ40269.1 hypothetical protein Vwe01_35940 [Micromonospora andamanensis]